MSINIFNLEKVIAQKIATATSADDIVYLTSALKQLKNGSLTVVTNYSELPTASSLPLGSLYFVKNDKIVYSNKLIGTQYLWKTLVLSDYNYIYSWGAGSSGQLGDGTTVCKSSPVSVLGGFTDWCQISSGDSEGAAIRTNGTLWTWGTNAGGRLGDGTVVSKSSPVSVIGGFTDWCQVSVHRVSSAIRTNCTLWSWGYGAGGILGDGTTVNKSSPVSVVGGFTDWCGVSVGNGFTHAIRTNGTIWSWGYNTAGALGDGTTVNKCSPGSVIGGFTDWCQVSSSLGGLFAAGVRTNGTIWSWGCNGNGRLGDGTVANKCSPISVVGGFTDWCQVSTGACHTAALRTNGTLWTWGGYASGRLGDNTSVDKCSPVSVVGGFTDWCQVAAGGCHTAALRTNGTLWAWGLNNVGQLGDGTSVAKSSPISVTGSIIWSKVFSGRVHVLAIRKDTK